MCFRNSSSRSDDNCELSETSPPSFSSCDLSFSIRFSWSGSSSKSIMESFLKAWGELVFRLLEHHYLAAKIKSHEIVFEETVTDVHLKFCFIMAGPGRPERGRSRFERQSADAH